MSTLKKPENIALKVMVMPQELNHHGTAFGGTILAYLDQAGATLAVEHCRHKVVLVNMQNATFKAPIYASDRITFYGKVVRVGTTSITVNMEYWRTNLLSGEETLAGSATIVYVAVDNTLRPTPLTALSPDSTAVNGNA